MATLAVLLIQVLALAYADIYLHSPRGSNNRLNGDRRERRNANRVFDSQNNNRGGYNVGSDGKMYYYSGSVIPVEWTNQHSCNDPNNNCELILQYMCGENVRDGTRTSTIPENDHSCRNRNCTTEKTYGMNEDSAYYARCKTRARNWGLFTADQKLRGYSARYTRQNRKGTRRGYECPEERDYYPYWESSPWKDIAVMTNDVSRCKYYQQESQNVKERYECVPTAPLLKYAVRKRWTLPNDQVGCAKLGKWGSWQKIPSHNMAPPVCIKAPWSRDNHNGNGMSGYPNMFNWTAPDIDADNCVLRIRYNISTNDFDAWGADASLNDRKVTKVDIGGTFGMDEDEAKDRGYVYKNNPVVEAIDGRIGSKLKVRLAINTAQYGRTFQDRSHTFSITKRPKSMAWKKIVNVNVRGKRGNIVQVYPAVEYDYVPNVVTVSPDDYIHYQWTGSDRNPRNNDGQGTRGTDRSNVILQRESLYPEGTPGKANPEGKFGHWGRSYPAKITQSNLLGMSTLAMKYLALVDPGAGNRKNCRVRGRVSELDAAPAYFDLGPMKATTAGTYHYMCTRNNNFSNRSQKGKIVVTKGKKKDALSNDAEEDPSDLIDEYNAQADTNDPKQGITSKEAQKLLKALGGKSKVVEPRSDAMEEEELKEQSADESSNDYQDKPSDELSQDIPSDKSNQDMASDDSASDESNQTATDNSNQDTSSDDSKQNITSEESKQDAPNGNPVSDDDNGTYSDDMRKIQAELGGLFANHQKMQEFHRLFPHKRDQ